MMFHAQRRQVDMQTRRRSCSNLYGAFVSGEGRCVSEINVDPECGDRCISAYTSYRFIRYLIVRRHDDIVLTAILNLIFRHPILESCL